jgi:predicted homoserine dehydrogenase-like protein
VERDVNLFSKLLEREAAGRPVTVGLIGAGKFGTMFLSQARLTRGMQVAAVIDLDVARAKRQLDTAGWDASAYAASSLDDALKRGATFITDNAEAVITHPRVEVIIDATGVPGAGIAHALSAIENGKHIVMVNVEADVVAGPLLARKAKAAGVVYSLAWGDQPALICEHVDWARAAGFKVICAGKGTRYEPHYHQSNPDNVWDILDKNLNNTDRNSINPKMIKSFVDGTKSGI